MQTDMQAEYLGETHSRNRLLAWAEDNKDLALEVLRIYLGVGLFVRGALFIDRSELILDLIRKSGDWLGPLMLTHLVTMAHLAGGLLLAFGLFTRAAALIQIPPVLGAVFFVHFHDGLFTGGQGLELSVLVLVLLSLFALVGSGRLSADAYIARAARAHWERVARRSQRPLAH